VPEAVIVAVAQGRNAKRRVTTGEGSSIANLARKRVVH